MSILSDLTDLSRRIDGILDDIEVTGWKEAYIEAVMNTLEEYSLSDLSEVDLATAVEEALDDVSTELGDSVRRTVAEKVQTTVQRTARVYRDIGVEPPSPAEAGRRADIMDELGSTLDDGLRNIDDELRESTISVLQKSIAEGEVDRNRIQEQIQERADVASTHAKTQTELSVSSYNQHYRNELAGTANLQHYLYAGTLIDTSRRFCRYHLDRVFTPEQIAQMDNGQIDPVQLHTGGYRCRHNLMPVDPEWDEDLQDAVVPDSLSPVTVELDGGKRTITVFPKR